jgi:hypothetical protein
MAEFGSFDVNQLTILVGAILIDSGFAEDDVVKVEPGDDDWLIVKGADGSVARSKSNDKTAKVTLRLLQTSPKNALLSAARALDANTPGGAGVGPFMLNDRSGVTKIAASKSFILGRPKDISFGKTIKVREWVIFLADEVQLLGGN